MKCCFWLLAIETVNHIGRFCSVSQHCLSFTQRAQTLELEKFFSNFTWQLGVTGAAPLVAEPSLIVASVPFSLSLGSLEI